MGWIKNNWKPLTLLAVGLLAIAALTTVILLRREDRGFMVRECVKGEGVNARVRWEKYNLPVPVYIEVGAEEFKQEVLGGILWWNEGTGLELMKFGGTADPHKDPPNPVILVDRVNESEHGKTRVRFNASCKILRADVKLPALAPAVHWDKVTRHELGHALGLDHDDFEASVMHPGGRAMRWGLNEITEADRALLASTYGPE